MSTLSLSPAEIELAKGITIEKYREFAAVQSYKDITLSENYAGVKATLEYHMGRGNE